MLPIKQLLSSRWAIVVQLLIAAFLVLGANLFDIVPITETPYLVALAILSMKLQGQGWNQLGFIKPKNWKRTMLIALGAAAFIQIFDALILEGILYPVLGSKPDLSSFEAIQGNTELLLIYFLLVWTLAAFGEEIAHRGFIMTKTAELFGSSRAAWIAGILVSSILFGLAHYYKGPAGMMDSGISGLLLGTLYVISGRNLWVCILTHGFIDTYALLYFYFGFYQS